MFLGVSFSSPTISSSRNDETLLFFAISWCFQGANQATDGVVHDVERSDIEDAIWALAGRVYAR